MAATLGLDAAIGRQQGFRLVPGACLVEDATPSHCCRRGVLNPWCTTNLSWGSGTWLRSAFPVSTMVAGRRESKVGHRGAVVVRAAVKLGAKRGKKRGEDREDGEDGEEGEEGGRGHVFKSKQEMKAWLQQTRRGFGFGLREDNEEGSSVDYSLEEKLLEEIKKEKRGQQEKGRSKDKKAAQTKPAVGKDGKKVDKKAQLAAPQGVEVRVGNLPRKRNVERDLQARLRAVAGLLHIRPVTSGSAKTREPVCTGLAYLTFTNAEKAHRFVASFDGKQLQFGKVEKRIACKVAASEAGPQGGGKMPGQQMRQDEDDEQERLYTRHLGQETTTELQEIPTEGEERTMEGQEISAEEFQALERAADALLAQESTTEDYILRPVTTARTVTKLRVREKKSPESSSIGAPVPATAEKTKVGALGAGLTGEKGKKEEDAKSA